MAKIRPSRHSFILQFTYASPVKEARSITFTPVTKNKHRLYLAIYARPQNPHSYHYALHLSPKRSAGPTMKFHCKNVLQALSGSLSIPWIYECVPLLDANLDARLLARIRLGKIVVSPAKFKSCMQTVPVDASTSVKYNCIEWIRRALTLICQERLLEDKGVEWLEDKHGWTELRARADEFVARKQAQQGRCSFPTTNSTCKKTPSLDLISMIEFVPMGRLQATKAQAI